VEDLGHMVAKITKLQSYKEISQLKKYKSRNYSVEAYINCRKNFTEKKNIPSSIYK